MVSGKNWTAAARAPGKLLLKLIFPGCATARTAAPTVEGKLLLKLIFPGCATARTAAPTVECLSETMEGD